MIRNLLLFIVQFVVAVVGFIFLGIKAALTIVKDALGQAKDAAPGVGNAIKTQAEATAKALPEQVAKHESNVRKLVRIPKRAPKPAAQEVVEVLAS